MNLQLLDLAIDATNVQLIKAYQQQAKKIIDQAEDLYLEMLDSPQGLTLANMYQQDRYYKLLASINKNLRKLGSKEIKILDSGMLDLYKVSFKEVNPVWTLQNLEFAKEVINKVWCSDGKLWSDRVWEHKTQLQEKLSQGIMDCVVQGKDHRKLAKELEHQFGVAEHQAECITRTELNRVQNRGAIAGYEAAGYTMYTFITADDDRTCDECGKLNGQHFTFDEAVEGVNFPPMHPNCRSNIIGYKPKE